RIAVPRRGNDFRIFVAALVADISAFSVLRTSRRLYDEVGIIMPRRIRAGFFGAFVPAHLTGIDRHAELFAGLFLCRHNEVMTERLALIVRITVPAPRTSMLRISALFAGRRHRFRHIHMTE